MPYSPLWGNRITRTNVCPGLVCYRVLGGVLCVSGVFASPPSDCCFGYVVPELVCECIRDRLMLVHVRVAQVFERIVSFSRWQGCEVVFDDVCAWFDCCWCAGQ